MDPDHCWAKAAEFSRRAEVATDAPTREFFHRLRDAWIRTANQQQVAECFPSELLQVKSPPL